MIAFVFPSGLGVREGAFALALAQNVPGSVAVALSVGARLVLSLVELAFIGARGAPREAAPVTSAPPVPRPLPRPASRARRVGWPRWPLATVWGLAAVWAGLFSYLSIRRHDAFWTGRFDLGNMVQAVWSTAQGRPLETTDIAGDQFVRLGAHVDPILVLFTPLAWTGVLPQALLVAQAVIVAVRGAAGLLAGAPLAGRRAARGRGRRGLPALPAARSGRPSPSSTR